MRNILVLVSVLILYSCNKNDSELLSVGSNFIEPNTRIIKVDTFGIQLSTIKLDSIVTSNSETALLGQLNDEKTGKTTSNSFFQLQLPGSNSIDEEDVYDSVALVLNYSGYILGDTTQLFSVSVHEVIEEMELFDDDYLYNNSSFAYKPLALGAKKFFPMPERNEEIVIRLNDSFGIELFEKLRNEDDDISTSDLFSDYLKGLVLIADNEFNESIIGFELADSSLCLRLYGHKIDEELEEYTIDFEVSNNQQRFNQIRYDNSATILENLVEQKYAINSEFTDNIAFVKGGVGLMTKISFPGLMSLVEITDGDIIKAELVLHPIVDDSNKDFLPENFFLYEGRKYNKIENIYGDIEGNPYYGSLIIDEINNEAQLTFDITDYVKTGKMNSYFDPNHSFILSYESPDYSASVNSIEIGGYNNKRFMPGLNVYFIRYETY